MSGDYVEERRDRERPDFSVSVRDDQQGGGKQEGVAGDRSPPVSHLDLAQLIERAHRRYLDVLTADLARLDVRDITAAQLMVLLTIGPDELSIRGLIERGHYPGSNASYNVKHLAAEGYLTRDLSSRDRRIARIYLTPKSADLLERVRAINAGRRTSVIRDGVETADVEYSARTLKRLDLFWTGLIRYGDAERHDS